MFPTTRTSSPTGLTRTCALCKHGRAVQVETCVDPECNYADIGSAIYGCWVIIVQMQGHIHTDTGSDVAVQVATRVCKHEIIRPSFRVSDSDNVVCATL